MDDKDQELESLIKLAKSRGWGVFGVDSWRVKNLTLVNCKKSYSIPEILFGDELGFMRAIYQVDKEKYPTHEYHLAKLSKMESDCDRVSYLSHKFIHGDN